MTVIHDIPYAVMPSRPLHLDLYLPTTTEQAPQLLVWIHGGAWRAGDKDDPPLACFVDEGYALASIQYRFSHEALFPAQIHDCKGAIRWLRAHAAEYGYCAERIAVGGSSAGGHLVALLGTSTGIAELEGETGGNLAESSQVQAVVDLYGPTNFLAMLGQPSEMDHAADDSPESQLVGGPVMQRPNAVKQADPITYIGHNAAADIAPFIIIHGDADPLVPHHQSIILHEALTDAGVESTLEIIAHGGHGGPEFWNEERVGKMRAFIAQHVG